MALPPLAASSIAETQSATSNRTPLLDSVHSELFAAWPDSISQLAESALPWLTLLWGVGVVVLSFRLLGGWWRVQRLKRRETEALGEPWSSKLQELKERLAISRPVRLLKSALVEVPMVIGWLKPVILFPANTLTGLTPAQLEAILVHELAHIRRNDYLVNLIQRIVETLLFYPAFPESAFTESIFVPWLDRIWHGHDFL